MRFLDALNERDKQALLANPIDENKMLPGWLLAVLPTLKQSTQNGSKA